VNGSPPRLARRLLSSLLPRVCREEALDDLGDIHELRRLADGAPAADRWYWRQVPVFALRLHWASLTGTPLGPHPSPPTRHTRREPMHSFVTDLRYGARAMLRAPAFTMIAVVTLALGIGANTAIFGVVRSVLLRPLPFPEPDRIVALSQTRGDLGDGRSSFAHANFWDVRDMNRSLASVGAISWNSMTMGGTADPERVSVASVTAGFFATLGTTARVGRLFAKGEDDPGSDANAAVLSHAFWTARFGGESSVLTKTVVLDGQNYRILGVLPPGTPWLDAAEVFVPMIRRPGYNRDSWEIPVIARLAPGVSVTAAQADLDAVAIRIAGANPEIRDMGIAIDTTEDWVASESLRQALLVLLGAVGFLLLIACVNLANMLLARATSRARERALRSALGATRARVVQLALAESVLLGVVGSALGLALAFLILRYLRVANPGDIPRLAEVRIDSWVLLVALGAGVLTSVFTGLVPGLTTTPGGLAGALRDGDRGVAGHRGSGRLRRALVTLEVALSLMLLVGAGLLLRSFTKVLSVDRGFQTENRLTFDVGFSGARTDADATRMGQQLVELLDRIRAMPQVASAAAVHLRPLRGSGTGMGFGASDRPDATGSETPWAGWRIISKDYFTTLGVPLVEGRDFTEHDLISARPRRIIVSSRVARLLWPGESALGRQLVMWKGQGSSLGEIIGVAGDMRDWGLTDDPSYSVYMPVYGTGLFPAHLVVHTALPSSTFVPRVRAIMAQLNPSVPVFGAGTLGEQVGQSVAARRFTMVLLASLAGVALLLSVAGVYGVLSYTVSQRRSEVGVRMALGASRGSVLRLVMTQGLQPVWLGLVAGLVGAVALSRFMTSLLFGMTPMDVPTYAGVALLLAAAAALACYLPARDAMRVDVLAALRDE
jgi:putative ABC transport system permease protein